MVEKMLQMRSVSAVWLTDQEEVSWNTVASRQQQTWDNRDQLAF